MEPTSNNTTSPVRYLPKMDGVDHININHDGKTELGRMLSHFYESPFVHPYLGPFDSMEGFWQYVKAEAPNDRLRTLVGQAAFALGKTLTSVRRQHFRDIIMDGNFAKIDQNSNIKAALVASELPITQYYTYGPQKIPINPKTAPWLIPDFEELRRIFKTARELKPLSFENYNIIASSATSRASSTRKH